MPSLPNTWPSDSCNSGSSSSCNQTPTAGATGSAGCSGLDVPCITVVDGAVTNLSNRTLSISPSDLEQQGATTDQAIVWNGTEWAPADQSGSGGGSGGAYITIYDGVGANLNLNSASNGDPFPDSLDPITFIIEGNPSTFRMSTWVTNSPSPGVGNYGLSFDWSTDNVSWTSESTILDLNGKSGELVTTTGSLSIPGSPSIVYIRLRQINETGFDGTSAIREMVFDFGATGGGGGGSGTVTSVSVATANGFSGTVANPTTTPAITIIAGAITPTSVAASGTVTGSNLSGTNTGDQTITLTGDVTGSGTGSFAATIGNDKVTYAKMQNVSAASKLLGRGSVSGAGDVEEITLGTNLSMSGTTLNASGGGGGGTVTNVSVTTANGVSAVVTNPTTTPDMTFTLGAITPSSVNGNTITTGTGTLTLSTFTLTVSGTASVSGTNTGDQTSVSGNAGTVTVGDAGGDTTTWVLLGTSQTGNLSPSTDAGLTYNATTDALTATTFVGALNGNATTATAATNVTAANEGTDTTCFPIFVTAATGDLGPKTNANLTFNSNTGALGVTTLTASGATSVLLGTSGSLVGDIGFRNATSGTITLAPQTGALGTVTLSLPAVTATVCAAATSTTTTQALFATATAGQPAFRAIAASDVPGVNKVIQVGFSSDGGGSVISTGQVKGFATCAQAGTISAWTIAVDTGTCTVKCWKVATGTAVPTISNVINTSGVAISSGTYVRSTTTSDFTTTAVAANDIFAFDITAVSGATVISFALQITPT